MAHIKVKQQRPTPLMTAVQNQDVDAVRVRIEAGDNIEEKDSWGQTALHWASKYESVEIVELLLEAGANFKAKDEDGDTPLKNADKNTNPAIAEAMARGKRERGGGKKWWQFGK